MLFIFYTIYKPFYLQECVELLLSEDMSIIYDEVQMKHRYNEGR